jgi:hypothetical protein
MRTLLEMHYDDVYMERYLRRTRDREERKLAKRRKSDYKVFKSVVQSHKRKLCQRIELPQSVKDLLPTPKFEEKWDTLEKLRKEIVLIAQGRRTSTIDSTEEASQMAAAICQGTDNDDRSDRSSFTSIGEGVAWILPGSRLLLAKNELDDICNKVRREARRDYLVEKVRLYEPGIEIQVLTRPFGTSLAPPQDPFIKLLADERKSLKECGRRAKPSPLDENDPQAILDHLLLSLWDALFLDQCVSWTKQNVTNLPVDHTFELARYFNIGFEVSKEGLYTGMCAICANLLYGPADGRGKVSNCKSGMPLDREGQPLTTSNGSPDVDAQPCCFLRFSPNVFQDEAPYMFKHNADSNVLSLGRHDEGFPWISEHPDEWLYCVECFERYINGSDRSRMIHVPFRDKASQGLMKPTWRERKREHDTLEKPEPVADTLGLLDVPAGDEAGVEDAKVFDFEAPDSDDGEKEGEDELPAFVQEADEAPNVELPEQQAIVRPTLQEYQERWTEKLVLHSRGNDLPFSGNNLCPKPVPQLWNNAPHVSFDKLKSPAAQGRLALCRPISGIEESTFVGGLEKYAHSSGDVSFSKRAPCQIASTMAFVLNKNTGSFMGLTEKDKLHVGILFLYDCYCYFVSGRECVTRMPYMGLPAWE